MVSSAAVRARLALLVLLLSELGVVFAGAPAGARQAVRMTIDVVAARTCAATLAQEPPAKSAVDGHAQDRAPFMPPAATPSIARASSRRAGFATHEDSWTAAKTCDERARGPPVRA